MKIKELTMKHLIPILLLYTYTFNLHLLSAAVPLRWTVETSRATPATFEAYQGETLDFEATLQSYGKPLEAPVQYAFYWQTNGMGSAYWSAPCTVPGAFSPRGADTNTLRATWLPSYDVGARAYNCFIGLSNSIYHAAFQLRLRPSPGAVPNELPLPQKVIDFSQVTVLNPPWSGGVDTNAVIDIATPLISAATNDLNTTLSDTISSKLDKEDGGVVLGNLQVGKDYNSGYLSVRGDTSNLSVGDGKQFVVNSDGPRGTITVTIDGKDVATTDQLLTSNQVAEIAKVQDKRDKTDLAVYAEKYVTLTWNEPIKTPEDANSFYGGGPYWIETHDDYESFSPQEDQFEGPGWYVNDFGYYKPIGFDHGATSLTDTISGPDGSVIFTWTAKDRMVSGVEPTDDRLSTTNDITAAISTNNPAFVSAVRSTPPDPETPWGTYGTLGAAIAGIIAALATKLTKGLDAQGVPTDANVQELFSESNTSTAANPDLNNKVLQASVNKLIDVSLPIPLVAKTGNFTTESYKRFTVASMPSAGLTLTMHTPTGTNADVFECRFDGTALTADASVTFTGATVTKMEGATDTGVVKAGKVALMSVFWNGATWDVNWKVEG